ncbi:putative colanic acid biosynthesis acetyltransferase [Crateriforma spongiae]|uniref:putative colanic acid biosynthesis acetyltransferase n=1 Tax=Crateriforma spongiae TaxID=2724528 RepID=UPI0039B00284
MFIRALGMRIQAESQGFLVAVAIARPPFLVVMPSQGMELFASQCYSFRYIGLIAMRFLRGPETTDPFSNWNKLYRLVWRICWFFLGYWTPSHLWRFRRFLLVAFGANMGERSDVRGKAIVWYPPNLTMEEDTILAEGVVCYNQAKILVRSGAIVSQGARLIAGGHDIDRSDFQHLGKPIDIGRGVWVASEAFVGPGVTLGDRSVLGARGVTFRDLEANTVYVGNPAMPVRERGNKNE